jgi:membrane-bound lytic murein transglycosylase D
MVPRTLLRTLTALSVGVVVASCGPRLQNQPPRTTPAPIAQPAASPIPQPSAPPVDSVAILIATSQHHFEAGQQELQLGHLERAKLEFNAALEVLLESPYGGRADPRVREHFDRLVDRISTYEVAALTEGDGFAEKKYEPASIDALLELSTFETPKPSPGLQATVKSDLQTTEHDIPIPLNARVLAYIDLFQGRLRDWIQDGLRRGARYLPMIQNVFRAEGLPLDLAYVPLIESAFKPNAVSRAKAKGVWQFMQGTALATGLKQNWYIDERSDPEKATFAAAKYLKTLCSLFKGDWHLALASYNGGPGRVQKALSRSRLDDFWALASKPKLLPRETREYVPMILAAMVIARNPLQYGFDMPAAADVPAFDKVKLTQAVDLRRVAEWTGTSISEIQALNPELRRWTTPRQPEPGYELKVPAGTSGALQEKLGQADPNELATFKWYAVRRGDSIATIARKLGVSRTELAAANYLSVTSSVAPGQKLIVPRESTVLLSARADRPEPPAASRAVVAGNAMLGEAPSVRPTDNVKLMYRVKSGDSLSSIARVFNTTVQSLKLWNHLRTSAIKPGDRLTIITRRGSLQTTGNLQ